MIPRLFTEAIEITAVTEVVGGDGRVERSTSTRRTVGAFRLRSASDAFSGGVLVTDEAVAYLLPDEVVGVSDFLTVRGASYEIVSTTFPKVNLRTGRPHHVEVRVRRSQR
jgi:hypothetical protein